MSEKAIGIMLLVVFCIGGLIGNKTAGHEVEHIRVNHTKVIHEKPDSIKIPYIPEDCLQSIKYAQQLSKAAGKLDTESTKFLDQLSDARIAIISQDITGLNNVETRNRNMQGSATVQIQRISEYTNLYNTKKKECNDELR